MCICIASSNKQHTEENAIAMKRNKPDLSEDNISHIRCFHILIVNSYRRLKKIRYISKGREMERERVWVVLKNHIFSVCNGHYFCYFLIGKQNVLNAWCMLDKHISTVLHVKCLSV